MGPLSGKMKVRYGRALKIWNMYTHPDVAQGNRMCLNTNGMLEDMGVPRLGVYAIRSDMPDADMDADCSNWMFIKAGDNPVEPEHRGTVRFGDKIQLTCQYSHPAVFGGELSVLLTCGMSHPENPKGYGVITCPISHDYNNPEFERFNGESYWIVESAEGKSEGSKVHSDDIVQFKNCASYASCFDGNLCFLNTSGMDPNDPQGFEGGKGTCVSSCHSGHEEYATDTTNWQITKPHQVPDSCSGSSD